MNYPEYVEVNGKKYKINTDYKVAIACSEIAIDETIDDEERLYAIIYKLFGDEGLEDIENQDKLFEMAMKFLSCGKELKATGKPDMDFIQDMPLIKISFDSDYHKQLTDMHWWEFNDRLNGLSSSELGNCCLLNKVRAIRNKKLSEIKDPKERQEMEELQDYWRLKRYHKPKVRTEEQIKNAKAFIEALGIRKE